MTPSRPRIAIVNYGTGNLNSIKKTLDQLSADSVISSCESEILAADKIILPGIGHFGRAMESLKRQDLLGALDEAVLVNKKTVLGICLGMALMAKNGAEGDAEGLGWLDADAIRFSRSNSDLYKIPHMGWNQISIVKNSALMSGINQLSEFYFAHSYHLRMGDPADLLSETEYGVSFPSGIEKNNIFGVQYHPEKSHDVGFRVLKNFIEM